MKNTSMPESIRQPKSHLDVQPTSYSLGSPSPEWLERMGYDPDLFSDSEISHIAIASFNMEVL